MFFLSLHNDSHSPLHPPALLCSALPCPALPSSPLHHTYLGVEKREDDQASSVGDLLRDIETALDTVLDEREKQLQQQVSAPLPSSVPLYASASLSS